MPPAPPIGVEGVGLVAAGAEAPGGAEHRRVADRQAHRRARRDRRRVGVVGRLESNVVDAGERVGRRLGDAGDGDRDDGHAHEGGAGQRAHGQAEGQLRRPAPADRLLQQEVGRDGHRQRGGDADGEQPLARVAGALGVEHQEDRPVVQVDAVADDAEQAQRLEPEGRAHRPGHRGRQDQRRRHQRVDQQAALVDPGRVLPDVPPAERRDRQRHDAARAAASRRTGAPPGSAPEDDHRQQRRRPGSRPCGSGWRSRRPSTRRCREQREHRGQRQQRRRARRRRPSPTPWPGRTPPAASSGNSQ